MTKCIGSVTSWSQKKFNSTEPSFIIEDVRLGEDLIRKQVDKYSDWTLAIASNYLALERSALNSLDKIDCSRVQELVISNLENLYSVTLSVIKEISSSKLARDIKQRYYILYSCSVIEKLRQLLQTIGRLSELNQSIFIAEQRKRLISEESITIHTLSVIWSAATTIMHNFREYANDVFKPESEDLDDFNYLVDNLESFIAGVEQARVFVMDLTVTSWIQFNRLIRHDDLVNGQPFLCLCHGKLYFAALKMATKDGTDKEFLSDVMAVMLDYQCRPSLATQSVSQYDLIPIEVCYGEATRQDLAYFIVWHIYRLFQVVGDQKKYLLDGDFDLILQNSFNTAMELFLPQASSPLFSARTVSTVSSSSTTIYVYLSPHQEERLRLILLMVNRIFEKNRKKIGILIETFSFFDKHWHLFGDKYFDNPNFRVEKLTIFQLLTKLMNEVVPMYTLDGQAKTTDSDKEQTKEEKKLTLLWDQLLIKFQPNSSTTETTNGAASTKQPKQLE